jgi:hypothetical protein
MYRELYPNAGVIRWSEIYRNKKFHKVRGNMLADGGEAIPCISKINGDTSESDSQLRLVIFDRDYVIAKLATDLRLLIESMNAGEWEALMSMVYHHEI